MTALTYCTVEYGGSSSSNGSIYVEKAASTLTNCDIRYSKYVGIRCNNASPQITGGSVVNNNTNGIYTYGQSLLTINGTSFSGNGSYAMSVAAEDEIFSTQGITGAPEDRVQIRGGNISRDQSWRNLGIPFNISGSISVYKDATTAAKLTVDPGVQVKFNGNYYIQISSTTSKGALYAVGTESNPIIFTSDKPTPARGDWDSIRFYDATDSALTAMTYCTVEYGGSNSSNGNVYIQKSAPAIADSTIRFSKYHGIGCYNASPIFHRISVRHNNTNGIRVSWRTKVYISYCVFFGNGSYAISLGTDDEVSSDGTGSEGDGVEIRGGTVGEDLTWKNVGIPYVLSGSINIYKNATTAAKLTIEPGVQVKFNGNYAITVGSGSNKGALYAVGTESNPIIFTSAKTTPARGDWDSIKFLDTTDDALTAMAYCTVEYGGYYSYRGNVYIEKSAPTITNCNIRYSKYMGICCDNASPAITGGTIADNNTNGIYASMQSLITINGTSFYGNGSYAISLGTNDELFSTQGITGSESDRIEIRTGDIRRDLTWRNVGIPYVLTGSINVYKDLTTAAKLTIEPGVQVRFGGNWFISIGAGASRKGALYAVGTPDHPILFTSDKPSPQPGDWHSISFYDSTDDELTEMTYCIVEYGGYYSSQGNIFIEKANPRITNCIIRNSKYNGIWCSYASPTIRFCSICNNVTGIYTQVSSPQVGHCNIYGNSQYGVNNIPSGSIVDARFNWWGHPSGPRGQGPGSGDAITNYVSYEAWLGLSFSYPYYISEGTSTTKQLTTNGGLDYFYAKTGDNSNWTILIKDASQQTVRTFTESGMRIRQAWDGKDQSGQPLPAGSYSYQIQAQRQSDLSEATPLLGTVSIGPDYPVGFISFPLVGDCLAEQIHIFGSASDPDFKQYKLEYGLGPFPSAWIQIKQSTTSATNGPLGGVDLASLEVPYVTFRLTVEDDSSHITISTITYPFSLYQVNASPNLFSPNDDGKKDTTTVSAQFGVESDWTLVIEDPTGQNVIRTWTGLGSTISQLWDGKNESGEIQNDGVYRYLLTVSNASLPEPDIVSGAIVLDIISPIAQITDPTEGDLFSNVYGTSLTEIFGTASDVNFVNYTLEYGETSNPISWNLIEESSSAVVNNKLGELDNSLLANGEYTIRLTVLDVADNESSAIVHIRVGHLRLSLSSHQLNNAQSESIIVTTEVPIEATETIVIKDKNLTVVKTLVNNLLRNPAIYNDPWDGKDSSGTNLPQGAYYVVVSIITAQDQRYFLLDLSNTGGEKRPSNGGDPKQWPFNLRYPTNFSPYKGEMAIFTFDLDEPSLVDLFAKENLFAGRERSLLAQEPLASGSYSLYWDGTDDSGAYLSKDISGVDNYVVFWAYSLAENGIVVYGEKPEVTALSASPVYYFPDDEDLPAGLEISYSISRTSDVNIFIQNNQGLLVKTMNLGTQNPGAHVAYWDGRASNGQLADSGSYRIGVSLTDSVGNTSLIRYCLILVYY